MRSRPFTAYDVGRSGSGAPSALLLGRGSVAPYRWRSIAPIAAALFAPTNTGEGRVNRGGATSRLRPIATAVVAE